MDGDGLKSQYSEILKRNGIEEAILEVVAIEPANLVGEHYSSKIEYVTIKFKNRDKADVELFVKRPAAIADPIHAQMVSGMMLKEGKFLTDFVNEMEECCRENLGMDNNLIKGMFSKAYYSDKDLLVLENIAPLGYSMADKSIRQNFNQAKLIMESLAKLHSISQILIKRAGSKEAYLEKYPTMYEAFFCESGEVFVTKIFGSSFTLLQNMLQASNAEGAAEASNTVTKYLKDIAKTLQRIFDAPSLLFCVNHGDCWNNNMMFSKDMKHVTLVDLQVNRIASPCTDLGNYLFTSTSLDVLRQWKQLLRIYYDEFKLTSLKLGHPITFTFEELLRDFSIKSEMGFIFGLYMSVAVDASRCHNADTSGFDASQFDALMSYYVKANPDKAEGFVRAMIVINEVFQEVKANWK